MKACFLTSTTLLFLLTFSHTSTMGAPTQENSKQPETPLSSPAVKTAIRAFVLSWSLTALPSIAIAALKAATRSSKRTPHCYSLYRGMYWRMVSQHWWQVHLLVITCCNTFTSTIRKRSSGVPKWIAKQPSFCLLLLACSLFDVFFLVQRHWISHYLLWSEHWM